jgi:hypothetical protein
LNAASFFTTQMSFMTFDFLRNMGMYIDYKEDCKTTHNCKGIENNHYFS